MLPPHIYVSDESCSTIYTTQDHLVTSPIVDTCRPVHRGYSMESVECLGPGEMSSSREITDINPDRILPNLSIDPSRRLSRQETLVSSPTCFEEGPSDIYPVAPEQFKRYDKRRRM